MYRSLRRSPALDIPLRMRLTSNPGGVGAGYLRASMLKAPTMQRRQRVRPDVLLAIRLPRKSVFGCREYEKSFARMSELDRQRFHTGIGRRKRRECLIRRISLTSPGMLNANIGLEAGILPLVRAIAPINGWRANRLAPYPQ